MSEHNKLVNLTFAAIFAALIFSATYFISIPLPNGGYVNLGDCFIIIAGLILGPLYGAAAAAIGSSLSDILLGFALYAPVTFIVKALVAATAFFVFYSLRKLSSKVDFTWAMLSSIAAEIIMIVGYFIYECFVFSIEAALLNILANAAQGAICALFASIMYFVLSHTSAMKKMLK